MKRAPKPIDLTRESDDQRQVKQYLNRVGRCCVVHHKTHKRSTADKGVTDFFGCYRSIPIAIEMKKKGNTTTPEQEKFMLRAAEAGAWTLVAYSLKDVEDFIGRIDKHLAALQDAFDRI